jgi:hypothetical protein
MVRRTSSRCSILIHHLVCGHGIQIKDRDGDERDGLDECARSILPANEIKFNMLHSVDGMVELEAPLGQGQKEGCPEDDEWAMRHAKREIMLMMIKWVP